MNRRLKNLLLTGLIVAVAVGAWIYCLPYLAVSHIKSSLQRGDADALAREIDFPTLRSNLKDQINYLMASQTITTIKDGPFAALGALIGGNLVNTMIDAYFTPYGLSQVITHKVQLSTEKPQEAGTLDKQALERTFKAASYVYDSPSRFFVTLRGDNGEQTKLVLTRSGLSWRLTNILLPADFANSGSSSATLSTQGKQISSDDGKIKITPSPPTRWVTLKQQIPLQTPSGQVVYLPIGTRLECVTWDSSRFCIRYAGTVYWIDADLSYLSD